jgi:hypothetical protein
MGSPSFYSQGWCAGSPDLLTLAAIIAYLNANKPLTFCVVLGANPRGQSISMVNGELMAWFFDTAC